MNRKPPLARRLRRFLNDLEILHRENPASKVLAVALDRILRRDRVRSVVIRGARLEIRSLSPDIWVAEDSLHKEFEPLSMSYPKDARGVIIDAGGYIGTAAIALSRIYPEATVVTIEPCSRNFELLERNIRAFPNIRALKAAIVGPGSPDRIRMEDPGEGQWGFTAARPDAGGRRTFVEEVEAITMDSLLERVPPGPVLILKFDIEGSEREVFASPGAWIARCPVVSAELHERNVPGCKKAFHDCFRDHFLFRLQGEKVAALDRRFFADRPRPEVTIEVLPVATVAPRTPARA